MAKERAVTTRVPDEILDRLEKATNRAKNPYAPSKSQVILRGLELALIEVEAKAADQQRQQSRPG